MTRIKSKSYSEAITQRKRLYVGQGLVWVPYWGPITSNLCWAGQGRALFVDGVAAYWMGPLLLSERQARLWCGYHGFAFVEAEFCPGLSGDDAEFAPRRVLRSWRHFHVECYSSHRVRCPDCAWMVCKGSGELRGAQ